MQMLYNSDSYTVVQFDLPATADETTPARGGYEILDKSARRGIYLEGAVAETFQRGVQALVDEGPDPEALDDFIAGYTTLAQQPLVLH
jgi:hypothetical protein